MASRIALITFVDDEPGHISGGPVYPPGHPSAGFPVAPGHPGNALPWGPGHISGGPVYPPGHPSAGFPVGPGHPSQGLPWGPGHPSQGLPGAPGHPSQGLPGTPGVWPPVDDAGKPVDPEWGYSPFFGWFLVYCKGGGGHVSGQPVPPGSPAVPDQGLPPTAQPKK